jgi:hypothetical protein
LLIFPHVVGDAVDDALHGLCDVGVRAGLLDFLDGVLHLLVLFFSLRTEFLAPVDLREKGIDKSLFEVSVKGYLIADFLHDPA